MNCTYSTIIGRYVYEAYIRRGYKAYTYYYLRTLLFLCCSPTNILCSLTESYTYKAFYKAGYKAYVQYNYRTLCI